MKKLTIIIPFLNEGIEIEKTVKSIRETADFNVEIILIDDASFDLFDYEKISNKYDARYIKNPLRIGPAQSRDIGVELTETDYFLTVDGHMRFYKNNWWKIIISNLEKNERAIYCTYCRPLDINAQYIENKPHFGAYVDILGDNGAKFVLTPTWLRNDWSASDITMKIPCIFGATYTSSKLYWQYLKGLSGLKQYGFEEPYISIKAWMEGGGCYLIKNVEIGHLFRTEFPFPIDSIYYLYNKLVIIETLFPAELKNDIYNVLRRNDGIQLRDAMEIMIDNQDEINSLKEYYAKILKNGFDIFFQINNYFLSLEKESKPL
jgi:glycosyltransferase involved in cell wall biosynthesis